ncbi:hypothetical protein SAMD00019534_018850 [Acytostelium subglobosum LB1]|uniref:hypothetical protein n=1 Tax=Acytostelium subglobosum LB1 TaxID=1410327 RepID=UPI0006451C72|nr:hypothetical protein SAMD00019534_018850 [Acytostelium subglobosum LB1]GAM18710.1 hypothetical protein SAMD00019534_018850 [Acytostelium subglobosum LB1]|eukprot:XP_012757930.1 hypothetical protein SAMD00019534_018850 [Acytostelium subglobosum LB1]
MNNIIDDDVNGSNGHTTTGMTLQSMPVVDVPQTQTQTQTTTMTSAGSTPTTPRLPRSDSFVQEFDTVPQSDVYTDIYGFRYSIAESSETIKIMENLDMVDNAEHKEEWFHFIRNRCEDDWDKLVRLENDKSFLELLNRGVPAVYRKRVWLSFLKLSSLEEFKKEYFKLLKEKEEEPKAYDYRTEIKLDIERTFPTHLLSEDMDFKEKIQNILYVYSINTTKGYCQSLNYIAYMLLLIVNNEEESYWCLNHIADNILPDYYTPTMLGAQIDQQVFYDLLCEMFPELMNHFKSISVVIQILTIEWFLCLFSTILPAQYALIIWDNLFVRGSRVLLEIGLAFIEMNIDDLMKSRSHSEVVSILNYQHNPDKVLLTIQQSAKRIGVVLSKKKIQDLKLKHWQITKKQVKDNEELKDIKYLMKVTSLSIGKLKGLKSEFDVLSHDGTGIGYLQFHQIILRFFPDWRELDEKSGGNLRTLMEKMFNAMDEDNDSLLNFKELVKGISILSQGKFDQKLRLNKDYLTKSEVKSMIEVVHQIFFKDKNTKELNEKSEFFLENMEDKITLDGLKRLTQQYPLIMESFQTPDSHTYTSTSEVTGSIKKRSNSFHLLDEDRLQQHASSSTTSTTTTTPSSNKNSRNSANASISSSIGNNKDNNKDNKDNKDNNNKDNGVDGVATTGDTPSKQKKEKKSSSDPPLLLLKMLNNAATIGNRDKNKPPVSLSKAIDDGPCNLM